MVTCKGLGLGLGGSLAGESIWITGAYSSSDIAGRTEGGTGFGGKGIVGVGGSYSAGGTEGSQFTGEISDPSPASTYSFGAGAGLGGGYIIGECKIEVLSCK